MKTLLHRSIILFAVSPALVVVAAVVGLLVESAFVARQERSFEAIREGQTRRTVVAAFGKPDQVRPCGVSLWWGKDGDYRGKNDGRCVIEERYVHFLGAFGIGYSADGRVVSKYEYVSE